MNVLLRFDGGGSHELQVETWTVDPEVIFMIRPFNVRTGGVRAEWKVRVDDCPAVASLLGGLVAGAIPQPLSDYLQEAGAPEWVWRGVLGEPGWERSVPWPQHAPVGRYPHVAMPPPNAFGDIGPGD